MDGALDRILMRRGEEPMLHLDDVFRYAMARLNDREEAEDIAIEVVQALPCPCYRRDLKAYMVGMARRKVADRLRRSRPTVAIREADPAPSLEAGIEDSAMVGTVLQGLSDEHREVLTLKYIAGLTSAEIGAVLGKRPDAVDSQLQRARDAFVRGWNLLTSEEVTL